MRWALLTVILALLGCAPVGDDLRDVNNPAATFGGTEAEEPGEVRRNVPPSTSQARTLVPSIYDDGLACPGGCDPHVVLHPSVNGTVNAFLPPAESRAQPQECVSGKPCFVCFGQGGETCTLVTYRGSGPPPDRLDFSAEFYRENCQRTDLPVALKDACRGFFARAEAEGYDRAFNCINLATRQQPLPPDCDVVIVPALDAQARDRVERAQCLAMGQSRYNAQQADESLHRIFGCNYFANQKGTNSGGVTWHRLAPGSCPMGKLVGQYGTDCCSGDMLDAAFHPECAIYFPPR